jgi:hypothetical protein
MAAIDQSAAFHSLKSNLVRFHRRQHDTDDFERRSLILVPIERPAKQKDAFGRSRFEKQLPLG